MNKRIVYIERELQNHSGVRKILEKIKPSAVEWIELYKDVLNQRGGNWRVQKRYQSLILARRKDTFYYKASPLTHSIEFKHFYYNTLAINCLYDCEYCYLQGMFNTPHLVLFLNNDDFIHAADTLSKQLQEPFYMALSYDTDLPAVEHLYPYCNEWMSYADCNPKITIEIRTKSSILSFFANKKPTTNVVLSWSVNPEEIARRFEPLTPSPSLRIKAAHKAHVMGWPVMLCIDPIVYVKDFKALYRTFISNLRKYFDPVRLFGISIGTMRMNTDYLTNIRNQRLDSELLWYPFERKDGHAYYPKDVRKELIETVTEALNNEGFNRIFVYG
ncbi:MAG: radical SAM protein [Thermaurantimonas sp.]|uniref:SPL family radical SAM protein n=1 Tax=Thermaurantimonas sp. TaxID=2681568 RepID=UPI0039190668